MMKEWLHTDRRLPVHLCTTKGDVIFNDAVFELITAYEKTDHADEQYGDEP